MEENKKTYNLKNLPDEKMPREVFSPAIEFASANIIIAHNHPSGDPEPSEDDLEITKRLVEAGKIMGLEILDHLIIGGSKYVSLKEKGVM